MAEYKVFIEFLLSWKIFQANMGRNEIFMSVTNMIYMTANDNISATIFGWVITMVY